MGSIGAPELIVMGLIGMLVCAAPLAIVIWLVMRKRTPAVTAGLVQCGACGKAISPRASACPHCGEPRPA